MKVSNFDSPRSGKPVSNQFEIRGEGRTVFQSYNSVIAVKEQGKVTLDPVYWNYSKTTSKYRSQFLGETTKETQEKIDNGTYILANLN